MAGVLKRSLAAWQEAHGFAIVCIVTARGEHFVTVPTDDPQAAVLPPRDPKAWMSESQVRRYLARRGFSKAEAEDAIVLAREWATTFTRVAG